VKTNFIGDLLKILLTVFV